MKNILAENMRRFGTKNLNESFSGDVSNSPTKSNVKWTQKRYVNLGPEKIVTELLFTRDKLTADEARRVANQEDARIATLADLDYLKEYKTSGAVIGNVWEDSDTYLNIQNFEDMAIFVGGSKKDATGTAGLILLREAPKMKTLSISGVPSADIQALLPGSNSTTSLTDDQKELLKAMLPGNPTKEELMNFIQAITSDQK
jgi:hypothetical protein